MGQFDNETLRPDEDRGATVTRLGPPGWAEFAEARERFMRTVAVAGLETAWHAPARESHDEREERRP
jgi:hypothetical protein